MNHVFGSARENVCEHSDNCCWYSHVKEGGIVNVQQNKAALDVGADGLHCS
jgi:hypothetical protein